MASASPRIGSSEIEDDRHPKLILAKQAIVSVQDSNKLTEQSVKTDVTVCWAVIESWYFELPLYARWTHLPQLQRKLFTDTTRGEHRNGTRLTNWNLANHQQESDVFITWYQSEDFVNRWLACPRTAIENASASTKMLTQVPFMLSRLNGRKNKTRTEEV
jgi:hypothetical protein